MNMEYDFLVALGSGGLLTYAVIQIKDTLKNVDFNLNKIVEKVCNK